MRVRRVAVLILFALTGIPVAAATEASLGTRPSTWPSPRTITFIPDWQAARAALPLMPQQDSDDAWSAANTLARERFPGVSNSPVPVLLPYAIGDDAYDRATDNANPLESYLSGFEPSRFFHVGPTGYDATFILRTREVPGFADIGYKNPVSVQVSAFNLVYDLPQPKGAVIQPPGEIANEFPGLRRQILEHTLRYTFERFGIPYVVSIQCYDGPQGHTRLSCRNADRIALRFLRALRVVGGNPVAQATATSAPAVARPKAQSDVFRYHPPGSLVPGTAMRAPSGNADRTVYARIRFPAAEAPAYAGTQIFRKRGGAVIAPVPAPATPDDANPPDATPAGPISRPYVWSDNFCEKRHFAVSQCPAGLGHQGQDILGASCEPGPRKRDCAANQDAVVAAREGMILREYWHDAFFLVVNAPGERLRFRHLHMHPRKLDEDGIFSGRLVTEGQHLGTIGNYNRRPGLTTTHLHFEIQVPTRDGYVRVNPYMSLVASYEHLIGARGSEVAPAPEATDESAQSDEAALESDDSASAPKLASFKKDTPRIKPHGSAAKAKIRGRTKSKAKARARTKASASLPKASGRVASATATSGRKRR
jgi:murein DD-endopeptidase MepM/ murein hydrolase activator NlpD